MVPGCVLVGAHVWDPVKILFAFFYSVYIYMYVYIYRECLQTVSYIFGLLYFGTCDTFRFTHAVCGD